MLRWLVRAARGRGFQLGLLAPQVFEQPRQSYVLNFLFQEGVEHIVHLIKIRTRRDKNFEAAHLAMANVALLGRVSDIGAPLRLQNRPTLVKFAKAVKEAGAKRIQDGIIKFLIKHLAIVWVDEIADVTTKELVRLPPCDILARAGHVYDFPLSRKNVEKVLELFEYTLLPVVPLPKGNLVSVWV